MKTAEENLTLPENGQKSAQKAASGEENPEGKAGKGAVKGQAASSGAASKEGGQNGVTSKASALKGTGAREASSQEAGAEQGKKPAEDQEQSLGQDKALEGAGSEDSQADIQDWADAAAKIVSLEEELAALKEENAALTAELEAERAQSLAQKEEASVKLELIKAGALDPDYLCYKLGGEAVFDEEGNLLNGEEFIREAKKQYPALFRVGFAADIDGVKPGDGGMGSGQRPDTGFLTYSQEQRLRERR